MLSYEAITKLSCFVVWTDYTTAGSESAATVWQGHQ